MAALTPRTRRRGGCSGGPAGRSHCVNGDMGKPEKDSSFPAHMEPLPRAAIVLEDQLIKQDKKVFPRELLSNAAPEQPLKRWKRGAASASRGRRETGAGSPACFLGPWDEKSGGQGSLPPRPQ